MLLGRDNVLYNGISTRLCQHRPYGGSGQRHVELFPVFDEANIHTNFALTWIFKLNWLRFASNLEICLAYQNIWQKGSYLNRIIVGAIHLIVFLNRLGSALFK